MFATDVARKPYLQPARRGRGWGRVVLLAVALLIVSAQLAYGNGPVRYNQVVVGEGDTLWSIAQVHYQGDPRPRVDQIMWINHLASPALVPGQALRIPAE